MVVVDPATDAVTFEGQYGMWLNPEGDAALLAALEAVPGGSLVLLLCADECSNSLTGTTRAYMASALGSTLAASLGFRQSYALASYKGAGAPLFEQKSTGDGAGQVTMALDLLCATPAPTASLVPSPAPSLPFPTRPPVVSPWPTASPSSGPSLGPTRAPTVSPTRCDFALVGVSGGMSTGGSFKIEVAKSGVDQLYDYRLRLHAFYFLKK